MFDYVLAVLLLPLLLPVILLIAVILYLVQGAPVFFRQQRVGKNFELFDIYKFRTMRNLSPGDSVAFDAGNKSRITPLGRFLRKTKLDELPQIINVLKGEMSFVGPRPEVPEWVEMFRADWEPILTVKPGITDPASIAFRNEEEILAAASDPQEHYRQVVLPQKLALYKNYLEHRSLFNDLSILAKTLKKVITS